VSQQKFNAPVHAPFLASPLGFASGGGKLFLFSYPKFLSTILFLPLLAACLNARVLLGIDVLERDHFKALSGAKVALITNQTGVNRRGVSTVDLLHSAPNVTLVCLLTPEHGFRGTAEHGQSIDNSIDQKTGVPVYSLYGKTNRPDADMLQGVDTLVFDIQDIGTRFYTYITTMGMALETAADRNLRFVVLDRPNPIRGDIMEGDILDPDIKRMTGYFSIPVRHGLTVGELAAWMNKTQGWDADLTVIHMDGWQRSNWLNQTGLRFRPTSPNMRTLEAALLYPGIGCFEATNVSVGRGTKTPFLLFGAPWMDGPALAKHLNQKKLSGVRFSPATFRPAKDLYANQPCSGIEIRITDKNLIRPFDIFVHAFFALRDNPAFKPDWEEIRVVTGSNLLKDAAEKNQTPEDYLKTVQTHIDTFQTSIREFLLY